MLVLILSCWVGGTFKQCCGAALISAARALILQKFYGSGYGSGSGSGSCLRQKTTVQAALAPQHCIYVYHCTAEVKNFDLCQTSFSG